MLIYFARHGESEANLLMEFSNTGIKHKLTEKGIEQVNNLGENLPQNITDIYSSPLLRATESAKILSKILNIDYEIRDELIEFNTGILEGKSDRKSWEIYKNINQEWFDNKNFNEKIEGGESFNDIIKRFEKFINFIIQKHNDKDNILVISHGGTYRCAFPTYISNISMDFSRKNNLGQSQTCVVEYKNGKFICIEWESKSF